jgi:hypothetical protein
LLAGFNVWLCDEVKPLPLLAKHVEINETAIFLIASDDAGNGVILNAGIVEQASRKHGVMPQSDRSRRNHEIIQQITAKRIT